MTFILQPWQLYFLILAGWINRQQQEVNEGTALPEERIVVGGELMIGTSVLATRSKEMTTQC